MDELGGMARYSGEATMTLPAPSFQEGVSASNKPSCDDLGEQAQLKLLEMAAVGLEDSSVQHPPSRSWHPLLLSVSVDYFGTVRFLVAVLSCLAYFT